MHDLPLAEIKRLSREAVEALIRGRWKEGIEAAAKCDALASKHLSRCQCFKLFFFVTDEAAI
jgi:hypothetical protein